MNLKITRYPHLTQYKIENKATKQVKILFKKIKLKHKSIIIDDDIGNFFLVLQSSENESTE